MSALLASALALGLATACAGNSGGQEACACDCACASATPGAPGAPGPVGPTGASGIPAGSGGLADLTASANRKLMHDDGPGCLADLDRIAVQDPGLDRRLAVMRGQCEMLSGKCQEGKQRVAQWYVGESAFSQERADRSAEAIGSLRCRGGNSSPRDQLLGAYRQLVQGAYVETKSVAFCQTQLSTIERLAPSVQPRSDQDSQLVGGRKALFQNAATCFAKAGDCASAYAAYRKHYPPKGLAAVPDPARREKILRDSFRSSVALCKTLTP